MIKTDPKRALKVPLVFQWVEGPTAPDTILLRELAQNGSKRPEDVVSAPRAQDLMTKSLSF